MITGFKWYHNSLINWDEAWSAALGNDHWTLLIEVKSVNGINDLLNNDSVTPKQLLSLLNDYGTKLNDTSLDSVMSLIHHKPRPYLIAIDNFESGVMRDALMVKRIIDYANHDDDFGFVVGASHVMAYAEVIKHYGFRVTVRDAGYPSFSVFKKYGFNFSESELLILNELLRKSELENDYISQANRIIALLQE